MMNPFLDKILSTHFHWFLGLNWLFSGDEKVFSSLSTEIFFRQFFFEISAWIVLIWSLVWSYETYYLR